MNAEKLRMFGKRQVSWQVYKRNVTAAILMKVHWRVNARVDGQVREQVLRQVDDQLMDDFK